MPLGQLGVIEQPVGFVLTLHEGPAGGAGKTHTPSELQTYPRSVQAGMHP